MSRIFSYFQPNNNKILSEILSYKWEIYKENQKMSPPPQFTNLANILTRNWFLLFL